LHFLFFFIQIKLSYETQITGFKKMSHRGTRVSYIYSYQIILFENEIKIIKN